MHNFPQFKRQLVRRMTKRHGGKKCHEVGVSDEALIPILLSIRSDNIYIFLMFSSSIGWLQVPLATQQVILRNKCGEP